VKASGVILSGGRSSRMKYNKAFAEINSRSSIEIIIDKFSAFFDETIIISNEPEIYKKFGLPIYTDIYPRLGPISGIHSALCHSGFDAIFLLGCDVPFISMPMVKYMLNKLNGFDTVVPSIDSYLQPISAVYSKSCLPLLTDCLENNKLKLTMIFEELNSLIVDENDLQQFGTIEEILFNVNDSKALITARQIAGRLLP
jgi:molybdopterin-guanine dinucleotide biosynthesis protein A